MPRFAILGITGISVGLIVRHIIGDNGFGPVADALLGITGAFVVAWAIGQSELGWSSKASLTIWAAASLPYLAHVLAKGRTRIADRQPRQERASK